MVGGFNMVKCLGGQYLSYQGKLADLSGGIYLEFMIRASNSLTFVQNTIFAYQPNSGTPFFRVAYNTSSWMIYAEVLNNLNAWNRSTNLNAITPDYWSTVKVLLYRDYEYGYSNYRLSIDVDGQNFSSSLLSILSAGSPSAPYTTNTNFDLTSNVLATWCAESNGSSYTNYAYADISMFRLVKNPGSLYSDTNSSCQNILAKSDTLEFCESCPSGSYRQNFTQCVISCPNGTIPLESGACGNTTIIQQLLPCNDTSQCVNPFLFCNQLLMYCGACSQDSDCAPHTNYSTCINGACRGYRQLSYTWDDPSFSFILVPDSPLFLNNPPISNYLNISINGQPSSPYAISAAPNYMQINVTIQKSKMTTGANIIILLLTNLTNNSTEAVILQSAGVISHTWIKPEAIPYTFELYQSPQVYRMTFDNYNFYTVDNLQQYLMFNFTGYTPLSFGINDTNLTLITPSILEVVLLVPINVSIYVQEVTVDASVWNWMNGSTDSPLTPTFQSVSLPPDSSGFTIFYVSRSAQIAAIGTAALCFLADMYHGFSHSSYFRFYALTERISILRYVNTQYHPLTLGFFIEMDLDLSSLPYFVESITNSSAERNITILNTQNNLGYYSVFLQGYGGTALLQAILLFFGILITVIERIVKKKAPMRLPFIEKIKKLFVLNLNGALFLATTPKLILGLSIYFQSANIGSPFASWSFSVACIYNLGYVAVILILIKNAKNQQDAKNLDFFKKIEIVRHDFKETMGGRTAPLVFILHLFLVSIFIALVGISGQAQAAMLIVFSVAAIVYWAWSRGFENDGEIGLMILSEVCFTITGILQAILTIDSLDLPTRLKVGWIIIVIFMMFIAINLLYRIYELIQLVINRYNKNKQFEAQMSRRPLSAENGAYKNENMILNNDKSRKGKRVRGTPGRNRRELLNLSHSNSTKDFLEESKEFEHSPFNGTGNSNILSGQNQLKFPNQLEFAKQQDDSVTNWLSPAEPSNRKQADWEAIHSPSTDNPLHHLQHRSLKGSIKGEDLKKTQGSINFEPSKEDRSEEPKPKKKAAKRFVIDGYENHPKKNKFWKLKGEGQQPPPKKIVEP